MTWIKPSFCWMMYRCGWATKPGQERVLAIRVTRAGFEWALAHSCLSHPLNPPYASHEEWEARKQTSPVCVQWDPERDIEMNPLGWRSIQIGLGGEAVRRRVNEWTVDIRDITDQVREMDRNRNASELPVERPYPLSEELAHVIGAS